jgi:hypothetical protein
MSRMRIARTLELAPVIPGVYGSLYCAYSAILTVTTHAVLRIPEAVVPSSEGTRKRKSVAGRHCLEFRRKLGNSELMPF